MTDAARILIPVLGFGKAGGYRVLSKLATEWSRSGFRPAFLAPAGGPPPYYPTEAEILWCDLAGPVTRDPGEQHAQGRIVARSTRALMNGLRQVRRSFDVVVANQSSTVWPVMLSGFARRQRFYYIQADEAEYYRLQGDYGLSLYAASSYALPFTQIVNAPLYFQHSLMRAKDFVPPGVDFAIFHPKPEVRDFADGRAITIGCIGRREPAKGTQYVLQAFEQLSEGDPRFGLRVAYGNLPDGWTHPALEIVTPKDDAELGEYYRSIDILLAPGTVQHGAPHYPVMEAMACGTAVVTTGYMPAAADNAWIVPNRDPSAIVRAVREIVASPDYHHKVEHGLAAMQAFGWPAVAAKMIGTFGIGAA